MKFKKSYGQNFLRDNNYLARIAALIDVCGKVTVEIGPGSGQLTRQLIAKSPQHLYCVEKDGSLITLLSQRFASPQTTIIQGDILKFDLSSIGENIIVTGNVPFNISNQLIRYLVSYRLWIGKAYLSFQKEFASKITAAPGSKEYGYLSCFTQYYCYPQVLLTIPRDAFYPRPSVDAALVCLDFSRFPFFPALDEQHLFSLLRKAFTGRRKKIINTLGAVCDKKHLISFLGEVGISPDARPESITLEQYCRLAALVMSFTKGDAR